MSYEKFQSNVRPRIQESRKKAGLTQEDVSRFGFNARHYQDIEAGKVSFTLETLYRLAQAFSSRAGEFIEV